MRLRQMRRRARSSRHRFSTWTNRRPTGRLGYRPSTPPAATESLRVGCPKLSRLPARPAPRSRQPRKATVPRAPANHSPPPSIEKVPPTRARAHRPPKQTARPQPDRPVYIAGSEFWDGLKKKKKISLISLYPSATFSLPSPPRHTNDT